MKSIHMIHPTISGKKNDAPVVSIITPVSQTNLQYVENCIESVKQQTYPMDRIEMIICEDGSTQEYSEKLTEIVNNVKQLDIKLIINKSHNALSSSRNKAINTSKGDWLFILDSDDVIERTAVEDLVNAITSNAVMVYADHARVSSDLKEIKYFRRKSFYHGLLKKYVQEPIYNPIYSSVYISHGELIKKDVLIEIGGYRKNIGEKPPVWISIFEKVGITGIIHVPKVLYYYRDNKNGIATTKEKELIKTHERTFFESIKKHHNHVSAVKYIGRVKPFMVKHFAFYDKNGRIISMPYIDYDKMFIKG